MERLDPTTLPIERAGADDAPAIYSLLRASALWLREKGIDQWDPDQFTIEGVARGHLQQYDFYIIRADERALGAFRLQWADRSIWGDDGEDGAAGYVHNLAVARDVGGRGLGAHLIDFAVRRIVERERPLIRLDCWAGNDRLCRYYADAGFRRVRDVRFSQWDCALWERSIAPRAPMP